MTAHELRARGLSLGYGDLEVIDDLHLLVPDGRITMIVGASHLSPSKSGWDFAAASPICTQSKKRAATTKDSFWTTTSSKRAWSFDRRLDCT